MKKKQRNKKGVKSNKLLKNKYTRFKKKQKRKKIWKKKEKKENSEKSCIKIRSAQELVFMYCRTMMQHFWHSEWINFLEIVYPEIDQTCKDGKSGQFYFKMYDYIYLKIFHLKWNAYEENNKWLLMHYKLVFKKKKKRKYDSNLSFYHKPLKISLDHALLLSV